MPFALNVAVAVAVDAVVRAAVTDAVGVVGADAARTAIAVGVVVFKIRIYQTRHARGSRIGITITPRVRHGEWDPDLGVGRTPSRCRTCIRAEHAQ